MYGESLTSESTPSTNPTTGPGGSQIDGQALLAAAGFVSVGIVLAVAVAVVGQRRGVRFLRLSGLTLAAFTGAAGLLLRLSGSDAQPVWLAILGALALAIGVPLGKEFYDEFKMASDARSKANSAIASALRQDIVRMRDSDAEMLGVWRSPIAEEVTSDGVVAPYIQRTADSQLRLALRKAADGDQRLVVVAGGPKSGKTRTLYEAARTVLPNHWVLSVAPPHAVGSGEPTPLSLLLDAQSSVRKLDRIVIWIDDAHEHFGRGLTASRLGELLTLMPSALVVMTVHSADLAALRRGLDDLATSRAGSWVSADERLSELLESGRLDLESVLDPAEKEKAETIYGGVLDRYGVGQPERLASGLAAVKIQLDRYEAGLASGAIGAMLVRAALWWRTALNSPVVMESDLRELLELILLHESDLPTFLADAAWEAALAWASSTQHGSALLLADPTAEGERRWRTFDALVNLEEKPTGESVWEYLFEKDQGTHIEIAAFLARTEGAIPVLVDRLNKGDARSDENRSLLLLFAVILGDLDVEGAAERHEESGTPEAPNSQAIRGAMHVGRKNYERGEAMLWRALSGDAPDPQALKGLRFLFEQTGREDQISALMDEYIASGHEGLSNLALLMAACDARDMGALERTHELVAKLRDRGLLSRDGTPVEDVLTMGTLLAYCGQQSEALECFRRASGEAESPGPGGEEARLVASFYVWQTLTAMGESGPEASAALKVSLAAENEQVRNHARVEYCAALLEEDDLSPEAEPLLREAVGADEPVTALRASVYLAGLLAATNRPEEAREHGLRALRSDNEHVSATAAMMLTALVAAYPEIELAEAENTELSVRRGQLVSSPDSPFAEMFEMLEELEEEVRAARRPLGLRRPRWLKRRSQPFS